MTETDSSATFRAVANQNGHRKSIQRVSLRTPRRPNHRLKDLRRQAGWSPARLGYEAGGITAKSIRDIESGFTREPRASTMRALADALRVPVRDIDGDVHERELVA